MDIKKMNDNELEYVTGGQTIDQQNQQVQCDTKTTLCPVCKEDRVFNLYTGGRAICQTCGKEIML